MQLALLCSGVGEEDTEPFLGVITAIQPTTAVSGVRRNVFYGFAEVILRGCKKCTVRPQSGHHNPQKSIRCFIKRVKTKRKVNCCCCESFAAASQSRLSLSKLAPAPPGLSWQKLGPGGSKHRAAAAVCRLRLPSAVGLSDCSLRIAQNLESLNGYSPHFKYLHSKNGDA